jgi:hypothetical protein
MGQFHDIPVSFRLTGRVGVLLVCIACTQCGGNPPTSPTTPNPTGPGTINNPSNPIPPHLIREQIFAGAGDIAKCNDGNAAGVARLLDSVNGGTFFTLGDNAYMSGTEREFRDCYHPTWGRHRSYTFPSPGNHEYAADRNATAYFDYFGTNAGTHGDGYYSFALGEAWHAISLNSEVPTSRDSPQGVWLANDLAMNRKKCTVAYWHKPLVSSGPNGDHPHMKPIFTMLYAAGVEIVMAGHDHLYERFYPQDPDGRPDTLNGIRQFIVGTGGVPNYDFLRVSKPNSERQIKAHGILKLTLLAESYQWEFIPVSGAAAERDSGGPFSCH